MRGSRPPSPVRNSRCSAPLDRKSTRLNSSHSQISYAVFCLKKKMELAQIQVREIMVPRPDIHALPVESNLDEVMRVFATTQRSRIPVYRGTPDHILGFVHIKDMIWILLDRERRLEENLSPPPFDLRRVLREVLIVPETKPASELLLELRARRVGMALVVDEFGSILGLVTMEDILEQMVGEIHDEFDVVERPLTLADGAVARQHQTRRSEEHTSELQSQSNLVCRLLLEKKNI